MISMKKTVSRTSRSYIAIFLVFLFLFAFAPISLAISPYDVKKARPPVITDEGILFTFKSEEKLPKYVKVIGDFNNWVPQNLQLTESRGRPVWRKSFLLRPGHYQYKYLIDGHWMSDPANDKTINDFFGGANSIIKV